jgi:UDP-N-acetyl-D-glucosamine/UDP-N-acetyl-D-galactosamine dehydrogenase
MPRRPNSIFLGALPSCGIIFLANRDQLPRICVIGLGYVGLPLAVALSQGHEVYGLDVDRARIDQLQDGDDRTGEVEGTRLRSAQIVYIDTPEGCGSCDFYIVTVPTPIDANNRPDLSIVESASRTVGLLLSEAVAAGKTPIVIYESTVYPGVTEEFCKPILEESSGLSHLEDFHLAYSPERINPGDREHTIDRITKIVSGDTPETLDRVAALYGSITSGGVFRAKSIRTAEAAKVIENAQRDINIAFMNEIAQIFGALDISVWDVLDAANTKWNFLPFRPGLVGGHCIGVDPYYLSHRAEQMGHDPRVILAGRGVNDAMAQWIAGRLHERAGAVRGKALVLGLTFKENVPDLRNSKVADLIGSLQTHGHEVTVHDPLADAKEAREEYGIDLETGALPAEEYDLVILAVPHAEYLALGEATLRRYVAEGGVLADLKGVLAKPDWTL